MTGPQILIVAIIIVLVIAFIVTMLFVNAQTSKLIDVNVKLAESQRTLLSQNKTQTDLLEKLEEQNVCQQRELTDRQRALDHRQQELDDQRQELDQLYKRLAGQQDKVTELRQQAREHRQQIKATQAMTDEELMAWLDERMDDTRLFTTPTLSLKDMAKALGLTQTRLGQLFKNHEKYAGLGDYLTEKRLLQACELMRDNPEWTIEAVAKEAGFLTRRTFQEVVKSHFGLTPTQFRQTLNSNSTANANLTQSNRIIIKNNVTLILTDGKTLTAQKGISVTARDNAALTVLAQSDGTGALTVTGVNNQSDASIGGDFADGRYGCGTVKIYGGHISTSGKLFGAGIGGAGGYGAGGTISILGGQVDIYNGTNGNNAIGYGDGATGGYATATITLGWTRETDYIHLHPGSTGAACYKGTVTLASNFLIDGVTPATRARWTSESNNIDGQKLVPNTEGLMDWSEVQEGLTAGQTVTLTNDVASASTDKTLTVPNGVTAAIDLNGHTLTHQYASDTGLETAVIVIMNGGTLTISDGSSSKTGKIVGNKTGIYNQTSGSTLTMTGGTINTIDTGILNYGTVTLSGVTVSGSSNSGINSGGTLSMADCSVTGNSGGGIYNSGTLNLAGKITVTGNTRTSNSETYDFNLFLSAGIINLTGALTDDSRIGVYGANCAITSGANGKAVLANFISDATDQYICWTTDGTEVQLNQLYYMNERDGMADLVSRHQGETVPVRFVRSFTDGVATTICLPFQINSLTYEDYGTFYRFVGVDESTRTVTMEDANKLSGLLDPNTPYLFMPKVSEEVSFRPQKGTITVANSYTAGTMVSGSWTLSGTYSAKIWDDEDTEIDKAYFINDEGKLQKIVSGMKTAPMSCYLLREVESLTLYDSNSNADGNTSAIAAAATSGNTYDVTLSGRTLTKDGNWNTLCLPFDVTLSGSVLDGATVKELDATNSNLGSDGMLTLTFKEATSIEAGKPYLVKWTTGENISNPVFNGVTITATAPTAVEFDNNANASGNCQFVGQFSPFTIDDSNQDEIILLGAGNTLGYSQATRTLRSFRAHFMVPTDGGAALVRGFVLDFGEGQTTSITEMRNEELEMRNVFNLNGQRVSQPSRGLYIVNGKKVLLP